MRDRTGLSVFGLRKDNDEAGRDRTFAETLKPGYDRVAGFNKPIWWRSSAMFDAIPNGSATRFSWENRTHFFWNYSKARHIDTGLCGTLGPLLRARRQALRSQRRSDVCCQ